MPYRSCAIVTLSLFAEACFYHPLSEVTWISDLSFQFVIDGVIAISPGARGFLGEGLSGPLSASESRARQIP